MWPRSLRPAALPWGVWGILALHLAFLSLLYLQQGIHDDKEALKYIGAAEDLLRGDTDGLLDRYRLYTGYVLFLVPFVALGVAHWAVLAQIAIGIAAAFALKRMVGRAGATALVGHLAMAAYLLAFPIQQWTLSLYSEGLFTPLVVLFLARALHPDRQGAGLIVLAIATVLTRPTGLLFVLPALLLPDRRGISRIPIRLRWGLVAATVPLMLFAPVLPQDQLAGMLQQPVVLGQPQRPEAAPDIGVRTLAHVQAEVIRTDGPMHWVRTMGGRVCSLYNPARPWFSTTHNAMVLPLLLLYPFAIVGLWSTRRSAIGRVCGAALALNTLLVALTYDEWGGRFLAPLLPVAILLASLGLALSHRAWRKTMP